MIRALIRWIIRLLDDEDLFDPPIGLEDMHELAGGKLPEPR